MRYTRTLGREGQHTKGLAPNDHLLHYYAKTVNVARLTAALQQSRMPQ